MGTQQKLKGQGVHQEAGFVPDEEHLWECLQCRTSSPISPSPSQQEGAVPPFPWLQLKLFPPLLGESSGIC